MTNPTQLPCPPTADREYLADLRHGFQADYPPQTAAEQVLLNELIAAAQRLHHLNRIEAAHLQGEPDLATLGQISRQRTAATGIFHRSLRILEKNKAQRLSTLQNEANPIALRRDTNEANRARPTDPCTIEPNPSALSTLPPHALREPALLPESYSSSQPFNTIHHPSPVCDDVETPADPLEALIESYRSAHPDNPEAHYRAQKAAAHLHKFRPLGSPAQLRRELIAILQPPPE